MPIKVITHVRVRSPLPWQARTHHKCPVDWSRLLKFWKLQLNAADLWQKQESLQRMDAVLILEVPWQKASETGQKNLHPTKLRSHYEVRTQSTKLTKHVPRTFASSKWKYFQSANQHTNGWILIKFDITLVKPPSCQKLPMGTSVQIKFLRICWRIQSLNSLQMLVI